MSEPGLTLCWSMANAQPPVHVTKSKLVAAIVISYLKSWSPTLYSISPFSWCQLQKNHCLQNCQVHTGLHIFHSLFYIWLVYSCLKLKLTHNLVFNCNALFETRWKWFYIWLCSLNELAMLVGKAIQFSRKIYLKSDLSSWQWETLKCFSTNMAVTLT